MATTCHIVALYHKDTKIAALGHFDGASTKQGVNDMLNEMVEEIVSRLDTDDAHLVGKQFLAANSLGLEFHLVHRLTSNGDC